MFKIQLNSKVKIGLALSGGGAKAIAHLGMMDALLEKGFHFDVISGTSAGSIIGAMFANGYSPKEILEIFQNTDFPKFAKLAFNRRGLLKIGKSINFLKEHLPETFEELKMPFIATTTNMSANEVKYFEKGELFNVILASCSIPVIFQPVEIQGEQHVDGGILDNLPVRPLREHQVDYIIGLHCNSIGEGRASTNWRDLLNRSLEMSMSSAIFIKKNQVNLFIESPQMSNFDIFDFKKGQEMYDVGYEYTCNHIKDIKPPKKKWIKSLWSA